MGVNDRTHVLRPVSKIETNSINSVVLVLDQPNLLLVCPRGLYLKRRIELKFVLILNDLIL